MCVLQRREQRAENISFIPHCLFADATFHRVSQAENAFRLFSDSSKAPCDSSYQYSNCSPSKKIDTKYFGTKSFGTCPVHMRDVVI